jgi:hypothetical protein
MMRKRWMWGLLAAAVLLPAVGLAAKTLAAGEACPIGCKDCPLCPLGCKHKQ